MRAALLSAIAFSFASHAVADDAAMIVIDASGSMWGQIDGVNKIVIAREAVRDTLGPASLGRPVGLIAYGHNRKGDCGDIEMLVDPVSGQEQAIISAVDTINPKGKTPLTDAVRQAAQALKHDENRATVVLVTDGLETCDADPCALARELEESGVDFTAHVVGFGLSKKDGAAVSCLAEETGGRYFEADRKDELATALSLAVMQNVTAETIIEEPPLVEPKHNLQINVQLSADSPPLENGQIDKLRLDLIRQNDGAVKNIGYEPVMSVKVDEGDYILRATYAGGEVEEPVVIDRFDIAHATLSLDAGVVDFRAISLSPDLIPPEIISWRIINQETGDRQERYKPELRSVFASGTYAVSVILGRKDALAPAAVEVEINAGDVTEGEIVLPHGAVKIDNVSDTGERLPDNFMRFALWTAKEDGTPDALVLLANDTRSPMLALPGDYILVTEDWGIAKRKANFPITIAPGSLVSRKILMPANEELPLSEAE